MTRARARTRSGSLLALAAVAVIAAPAFAHRHKKPAPAPSGPKPEAPSPKPFPSEQLAAEADTLARTLATVQDKLAAADEVRLGRLRAAIRALHAPLPDGASDADRMAAARRAAAAHLLLDRDAHERGLLADELARLRADQAREAAATAELAARTPPTSLLAPVTGTIARHFGPFEHDGSHAQLSRRGLDFEVAEHAPAVAPADGVVRYAGPIRGLDRGVILDHGDYLTVIAKLGELAVPVGAHVARGDQLGRAARHRVYFEVRLAVGPGGLPIDPEPLLASGPASIAR